MNYEQARALAQRLIDKNGRTIAMQRLSSAAADVEKPWEGPGVPTVAQTVSVKGVFLPHTGTDLGVLGIDQELLKRVEQVALIAGKAKTDFMLFHQVVDKAMTWKIEWIRVLEPGDTAVFYAIGVKR